MYHIEITPEELRNLQQRALALGLGADVQQKLQWFLYYLEGGESVAATCAEFGISRSTFYRWVQRFDPNDITTLEERSHRPRVLRKPQFTQQLVDLIRIYRMQDPYLGKDQIAELLQLEHGISVSASTAGRIIAEQNFYFGSSMLHRKKRMEGGTGLSQLQTQEAPQQEAPVQQTELQEFARAGQQLFACVWRRLRRPVIIVSLLANFAFIALVLATALWENQIAEQEQREQARVAGQGEHAAAPERGTNTYTEFLPNE